MKNSISEHDLTHAHKNWKHDPKDKGNRHFYDYITVRRHFSYLSLIAVFGNRFPTFRVPKQDLLFLIYKARNHVIENTSCRNISFYRKMTVRMSSNFSRPAPFWLVFSLFPKRSEVIYIVLVPYNKYIIS